MPTNRRPAIYITIADNGDVGSTTLKVGNIEISAAPPPMATITAAKSRATNTTPNTNNNGLQMMANITKHILKNKPTTMTNASPSFDKSTGFVRPHIIIHTIGNLFKTTGNRLSYIVHCNSLASHAQFFGCRTSFRNDNPTNNISWNQEFKPKIMIMTSAKRKVVTSHPQ